MDAPAMFGRKQVPEDVGRGSTGLDEGGQAQLHREDQKEHKPVLKKVTEKVKKIKHTLTGHSRGNGNDDEHERGERERFDDNEDDDIDSGEEEQGDAPLEREAALEKDGYVEDVEDKRVADEPDPEVHGAPMYESERTPAVQDLVAKYDPQSRAPDAQKGHGADASGVRFSDRAAGHGAFEQEARGSDAPGVRFSDLGSGAAGHDTFGQEARRDDSPKVRLGDLGGPVVEDPAAPRSTQPAARAGEDIGTTPVVKEFESMSLSDDASHVGAAKTGGQAEEWKDAAADKIAGTDASAGGATYTDKLKDVAAVPAEYGRKLASTVYEKVAGGTAPAGTETRDEAAMPVSDAGEEEFADAPAAVDADTTDRSASGPGYTDKVKATAAGTTEYGKQLAAAAYEKVAAVAPSLRPQEGAPKPEEETRTRSSEAVPPVSDSDVSTEGRKDAMLTDLSSTDTTAAASGTPGYTDKIKSAAAGTTEYGKQLASTVYEKVAGVGTAVVGKVQQATPGVGAQKDAASSEGNGQDKGVGVTAYIAEMLRPSDEDRALSETISSTVQRRKEDVSGTVGQVPAPGQVIAKAREAVTSLTGGNRVSETVQPEAATGAEVKENVGTTEAPVLRGEEVGEPKLNTNTV